jgi:hypothetical protein
MRSRLLILSLVALVALGVGLIWFGAHRETGRPDPILRFGITHTHDSIRTWDERGTNPVIDDARASLRVENQHIMGFGAPNPMPTSDEYDWDGLDARVADMVATSDLPVITLCCAPDWMKGSLERTTDWSTFEDPPLPEFYDDFARLAVEVAQRYPEVRHFIVWNELKGFHDPVRNVWDIESYTELYNQVYRALKAEDPSIQVGGPYAPMDTRAEADSMSHPSSIAGPWGVVDQRALDAITEWLRLADGADFVVVDGNSTTKDAGWTVSPVAATDKFRTIGLWIAERTDLPVWWAELHGLGSPDGTAIASGLGLDQQAAIMAASVLQAAGGGVDVALSWKPEALGEECHGCLWWVDNGEVRLSPFGALLPELDRALTAIDPASVRLDGDVVIANGDRIGVVVNGSATTRTVEVASGVRRRVDPWTVDIFESDGLSD